MLMFPRLPKEKTVLSGYFFFKFRNRYIRNDNEGLLIPEGLIPNLEEKIASFFFFANTSFLNFVLNFLDF